MTYDEFEEKFKPIENHIGDEGTYLFETYGEEVDYVSSKENQFIWTLIEVEGVLYITPGFHYVNRLNYLITEIPWIEEEHRDLEIKYED